MSETETSCNTTTLALYLYKKGEVLPALWWEIITINSFLTKIRQTYRAKNERSYATNLSQLVAVLCLKESLADEVIHDNLTSKELTRVKLTLAVARFLKYHNLILNPLFLITLFRLQKRLET